VPPCSSWRVCGPISLISSLPPRGSFDEDYGDDVVEVGVTEGGEEGVDGG
jgi:hypothetical protein